jgi:hypothetical protein
MDQVIEKRAVAAADVEQARVRPHHIGDTLKIDTKLACAKSVR